MATGQVLFQRFFYTKSFVKHSMEVRAPCVSRLQTYVESKPGFVDLRGCSERCIRGREAPCTVSGVSVVAFSPGVPPLCS